MNQSTTKSTPQERAGAGISLAVLLGVISILIWIGLAAAQGTLVGDRWPGRGLLLLMDNDALPLVGKSVLFILSFGASCLARSKLRDWLFYAIIALCFLGIVLSLFFVVVLRDPALADEMFNRSTILSITTYEAYRDGLTTVFVPLTLWLLGVLSVQLGIKQVIGNGDATLPPPPPAP